MQKLKGFFKLSNRVIIKRGFTAHGLLVASGIINAQVHQTRNNILPPLDSRECLKHASLMSVNSTTALLTTTLFLIDKMHARYKTLLETLTGLLDECVLLDGWNEELWGEVVALRNELDSVKIELNFLLDHMTIVTKIVDSAIEITFNVDANYLCTSLCESSVAAQDKLCALAKERGELENNYLLAQAQVAKYKVEEDFI